MSPLYEPQLLTTEFVCGMPKIAPRRFKSLTPLQRRYIYWGFANQIPQVEMADSLGCSHITVWRRIQRVKEHPIELLESGFVQKHRTRNGMHAFFCRFCGFGAKTPVTVVIHAYEHLFGEGSLKPAPAPVGWDPSF